MTESIKTRLIKSAADMASAHAYEVLTRECSPKKIQEDAKRKSAIAEAKFKALADEVQEIYNELHR